MADFFISYSRTDSAFAERLYAALISRKYSAWLDRKKLEGGQQFVQIIPQEIAACKCFLVLLTPTSAESKFPSISKHIPALSLVMIISISISSANLSNMP